MYILKDYAPYFARKEEFKRTLQRIQVSCDRWMFVAALAICFFALVF
jgi:hypothetical protein